MATQQSLARKVVGSVVMFVGLLCAWAGTKLHGYNRTWDGIYVDVFIEGLEFADSLLLQIGLILGGIVVLVVGAAIVAPTANPEHAELE